MRAAVLAVDLGGTNTRVALTGPGSEVWASASEMTPAMAGPLAIVQTVIDLSIDLLDRHPEADLRGIGIGTAGVVHRGSGVIVSATDSLAGWAGTDVAGAVRLGLGELLPASGIIDVQNDVDAHAWGEFRFGAARGCFDALVVAVGTGVGAGIIVRGAPLEGARHVAGAIAHMLVPGAEGIYCPCGGAGHLESIGSGVGMHRLFLARGGDASVRDARGVVSRVYAGDPLAASVLADSAAAVGGALAGAVSLLDPERVVITGGVPDIGELWWDPMRAAFQREAIDALQNVSLVAGSAGGEAALRGAADSVWSRLSA